MAACPQADVTDRAHRYRATKNMPEGEKRCGYCGTSAGLIDAGHIDGHEENGEAENLMWACRPCNVLAANTMRQVRPRAVDASVQPKIRRGQNVGRMDAGGGRQLRRERTGSNKGLASDMPVAEAVAIIRATPASKRSQFAAKLWAARRQRGNTRSNLFGFGKKKSKAQAVKRSEMTLKPATSAAFKAGQQSGDTGLFQSWAESKGLADRGAWLFRAYEKGVLAGDSGSSEETRRSIYRDVDYKGYRISASGGGFKTQPGDGTEFEDVKQAKRYVDDEVKMRKSNPQSKNDLLTSAGWLPWSREIDLSHTGRSGMWSIAGWYWFSEREALEIERRTTNNPKKPKRESH